MDSCPNIDRVMVTNSSNLAAPRCPQRLLSPTTIHHYDHVEGNQEGIARKKEGRERMMIEDSSPPYYRSASSNNCELKY